MMKHCFRYGPGRGRQSRVGDPASWVPSIWGSRRKRGISRIRWNQPSLPLDKDSRWPLPSHETKNSMNLGRFRL
jgi:hypothetical protein